ncbi:MAG: extracellular solute-binding protein [Ruminococcus sp.]|nr:extracellular solute-binding protein [Ruminococcus sp.]
MKNIITKITALTLSIALLSGCTEGSGSESQSNAPAQEIAESSQLFKCEELTAAQANTNLMSMEYHEDILYVLQYDYYSGTPEYAMYTYNTRGKSTKLFDYTPSGENAFPSDFCISAEGNFMISVEGGQNPDMDQEPDNPDFDWEEYYDGYVYNYTLETISPEGELLSVVETGLSGGVEEDENGNFIILAPFSIDETMGQIVRTDGTVADIAGLDTDNLIDYEMAGDGSIMLLGFKGGDTVLRKWNAAEETFEEAALPKGNAHLFSGIIPGAGEDTPFYLRTTEGLYVFTEDGRMTEIVNFLDAGLSGSSIIDMICTEENVFMGILQDENGCSILGMLSPREEGEADPAKILTLGTYGLYDDLSGAISEFNRTHEDYRIEVINYQQYDDPDDPEGEGKGLVRFYEDIAAGKGPDIVCLWDNYMNMAKSGALLDLYEVMGTGDTFPKEDFLPNYLKANEIDGHLYWIQAEFTVETMFVNADMTQGKESWTVQEFVDICRELDAQGIEITQRQDRREFMNLVTDGNKFIDFENGTCCFDDPSFLDALKFAEEMNVIELPDFENMTQEESDAWYEEDAAKCMNGERMHMGMWIVTSYQDFLMHEKMFGDQPCTMIGKPVLDESRSGHYFGRINHIFAITSACSEPEAAWQFIHDQLNVEPKRVHGLSIVDDILKESLQYQMESININNIGGLNGVNIEYGSITQEEIDAFYQLILSIEEVEEERSIIFDLYEDVMQGFYDGTKTAEETAEELQERVSLYLMENQ